jgi:uncharacterized protein YfdQ (DUF2303 family)
VTQPLPTGSLVAEIAALAESANTSEQLTPGAYHVVTSRDGTLHTVDLTGNQWLTAPRRKTGTYTVRDAASFLHYWDKHHDAASEIWADREGRSVTAIFDAHGGTTDVGAHGPRFEDHRLVLRLRYTDSFVAWLDASGRAMNQVQFAEFVEDHRPDIRTPPAAELLELAQTFQATSKATFRSQTLLKSGQRALQWVEQVDASAGRDGQITIPDSFELALKVFDGADDADAVTARLRYRINDGRLALTVILDQLRDVVDGAYNGVLDSIDAGVDTPILRGTPA